jgi:heptosyltransferase-1
MGDILHSIPGASALRKVHPDWVLGWAVEPRWQGLFRANTGVEARCEGMPLVDRVHIVNAKGWARHPLHPATLSEIAAVRRELRDARYDVCVDLQGAVRSALIGRSAGAARMIGEAEPREGAAKWFFGEPVKTTGRHVIEQSTEVLNAIAGELLPVTPVERYGTVAAGLARLGYAVVVNASPEEADLARELVAASGGTAISATPSLVELIELMRRSSLTIAGDTGPLHLACTLGKPVVGVFGPTDPARNGPYGCDFQVLRHPESKRDHSRRSEPEAGLLTIMPEAVLEAAVELLKGQG